MYQSYNIKNVFLLFLDMPTIIKTEAYEIDVTADDSHDRQSSIVFDDVYKQPVYQTDGINNSDNY